MGNRFAVVPVAVLMSTELSNSEKLCYSLLSGLTEKEGYCYASTSYLATYFEVNRRTVQRWLKNMEQHGFIRVEKKGNHHRIFVICDVDVQEEMPERDPVQDTAFGDKNVAECDKNVAECDKNVAHNNIAYNNNLNNNINNACAREGLYALPFRDEKKEPFVVLTADLQKYQKEFTGVDVRYCLNRMQEWLEENPSKRPKKNMRIFIANWLKRERDKTPQPPLATAPLSRGADKVHSGASEVKTGVAERLAQEKSASRAALEAFKKRRGV